MKLFRDDYDVYEVEEIGRYLMPDGRELIQVRARYYANTWWVDPELGVLREDD